MFGPFFVGYDKLFLLYPPGGASFPFGARLGVVVPSFAVRLSYAGLLLGYDVHVATCWLKCSSQLFAQAKFCLEGVSENPLRNYRFGFARLRRPYPRLAKSLAW